MSGLSTFLPASLRGPWMSMRCGSMVVMSAPMTRSTSTNYPTTPGAMQTFHAGIGDMVISRLDASGQTLLDSTYLGAGSDDGVNRITWSPSGDLYINGFAAQAMFYKGSLDKLGIEADVIQIGPKYKNAPDQYTKKEMGEGQREVINALLDEYYTRFSGDIAESRKKSVEDVKGLIDNAPYNAVQAKELGLTECGEE